MRGPHDPGRPLPAEILDRSRGVNVLFAGKPYTGAEIHRPIDTVEPTHRLPDHATDLVTAPLVRQDLLVSLRHDATFA
jgi:hypothetical protein